MESSRVDMAFCSLGTRSRSCPSYEVGKIESILIDLDFALTNLGSIHMKQTITIDQSRTFTNYDGISAKQGFIRTAMISTLDPCKRPSWQ